MVQCKNCSAKLDGPYCHHCGQSATVERFTVRSLVGEFIHGFYHVDHGILYTFKQLTLHPGSMLSGYLHGKRKSFTNPFTYLLLLTGVLALVLPQLINRSIFEELGLVSANSSDAHLLKSSFKHLSVRVILLLPVYALMSFVFFKRAGYHFAEHLIAQTYLRGQTELLALFLTPLFLLYPSNGIVVFTMVYYTTQTVYYTRTYLGLFKPDRYSVGFVKAILCSVTSIVLEILLSNATLLSVNSMMH